MRSMFGSVPTFNESLSSPATLPGTPKTSNPLALKNKWSFPTVDRRNPAPIDIGESTIYKVL